MCDDATFSPNPALTVDQHQDACSCVTLVQEVYPETTAENVNDEYAPDKRRSLRSMEVSKRSGESRFHSSTRRSPVAREGGAENLKRGLSRAFQIAKRDYERGLHHRSEHRERWWLVRQCPVPGLSNYHLQRKAPWGWSHSRPLMAVHMSIVCLVGPNPAIFTKLIS